jgi:hypothetical protein
MSRPPFLITFPFIWLMSLLDWVLVVVSFATQLLIADRFGKTILRGRGEGEASRKALDKAIQGFESELATFGTNVGFRTFSAVSGANTLIPCLIKTDIQFAVD